MRNISASFLIGVLVGVFGLLVIVSHPSSNVSLYKAAIAECEKSLPRDQKCKVIAVVVPQGEEK